jgi:hypothetical protein
VLQVRHELRAYCYAIDSPVGSRRVPALALHDDPERVERGIPRAVADAYLAHLEVRREVRPDHRIHTVHHAGLYQLLGSAEVNLLGVLEDEAYLAPDLLPHLTEYLRGPDQHRSVSIVAASVHDARVLGDELEVVLLHDRQCVHVSSDGDRAPRLPTKEPRDHACRRRP